jgi:anaerobic C4-dicarboxylate transporter-like protein
MTNAGLIEAICSAMGFAFVISYTRCDEHLVTLLSKPLGRLGLFLVPASAAVTFFVNTAIPSAAGCAAAVGATLIPLMMRSGIHPAGAAAAVLVGTYGSMFSPGMSHNVFVAKIAKMDIMALIAHHAPFSAAMMGIGLVGVTIACFLYKDHRAIAVGAIGTDVAGAAAAVLVGTYGSVLSPGNSHNVFVAKISKMDIMALIAHHAPFSSVMIGIGIVGITVACFLYKDHRAVAADAERKPDAITNANVLYALAPFVPLTLLVVGNAWVPALKMGVPQAMIIGAVFALAVTRVSPAKMTNEFFNGMGKAYGDVIGIIIAAGVFAAGLKTAGLIDLFIDTLKHSNEIARWGGSIGPFLMAVISGSGDAAAFAFNEAVTPHAKDFGMTIPDLGMLAVISGAMGRTMSPVAGVVIVVSGIAKVSPLDVVKRTAPAMIVGVITLALIMV